MNRNRSKTSIVAQLHLAFFVSLWHIAAAVDCCVKISFRTVVLVTSFKIHSSVFVTPRFALTLTPFQSNIPSRQWMEGGSRQTTGGGVMIFFFMKREQPNLTKSITCWTVMLVASFILHNSLLLLFNQIKQWFLRICRRSPSPCVNLSALVVSCPYNNDFQTIALHYPCKLTVL